eukprot:490128_1
MEQETTRMTLIKKAVDDLKNSATKHIKFESFGRDKIKDCDRGTCSGAARQCSKHLRSIYPSNIIADNDESEFCVISRHNKDCCNNPNNTDPDQCNLCFINTEQWTSTKPINISKAICNELNGNKSVDDKGHLQRRLSSFMIYHIGTDYPSNTSKKIKNTKLLIKLNGMKWIEYFIKLTAFSSMIKTSAPSGYKYKDRISLGRNIKIQGNRNKDLIFCITKDEEQKIDSEIEKRRPVVNGVGFWNLQKMGGIRNIIHINEYQSLNVCFSFLINQNATNIDTIEVELICNANSMQNTAVSLWSYKSKPSPSMPLQRQFPMIPPMPITMNPINHNMFQQQIQLQQQQIARNQQQLQQQQNQIAQHQQQIAQIQQLQYVQQQPRPHQMQYGQQPPPRQVQYPQQQPEQQRNHTLSPAYLSPNNHSTEHSMGYTPDYFNNSDTMSCFSDFNNFNFNNSDNQLNAFSFQLN